MAVQIRLRRPIQNEYHLFLIYPQKDFAPSFSIKSAKRCLMVSERLYRLSNNSSSLSTCLRNEANTDAVNFSASHALGATSAKRRTKNSCLMVLSVSISVVYDARLCRRVNLRERVISRISSSTAPGIILVLVLVILSNPKPPKYHFHNSAGDICARAYATLAQKNTRITECSRRLMVINNALHRRRSRAQSRPNRPCLLFPNQF